MADDKAPDAGSTIGITRLLKRVGEGDRQAVDGVFERVHAELRRIARNQLRGERADHTLTPTALVNEVYLKLVAHTPSAVQDRKHFFAIAARAMRQVLVTHAEKRGALKRGGERITITIEGLGRDDGFRTMELLALDRALSELQQLDPRLARIVEYRFFAGLGRDEIASLLDVSPSTVGRGWRTARAWLRQTLAGA